MEEKQETEKKRHYRIEVGDRIRIKRQQFGDYVFYKAPIKHKNADGTESWYDKNLAFPKGTDIEDGTTIIVKDFYEYAVPIKGNRYMVNWSLYIKSWDTIEEYNEAFNEFAKSKEEFDMNQLDELPF